MEKSAISRIFTAVIMGKDYVTYKCNSEKFIVQEVKIVDTDYIIRRGARWADFRIDLANTTLEGRTRCNWWENKGDTIKIAYDNNYHFIRPQIIWDDTSILMIIYCIIMEVTMVLSICKNK